MALATILGYPRVGAARELKTALEAYWRNKISSDVLLSTAKDLRIAHWHAQQATGLDLLPSNDFSLYDQVLDMSCLLGVVPKRYDWTEGDVPLDVYFAMARGRQIGDTDVPAAEMTKWFDTNYHYIVPEFDPHQRFSLSSTKPFDEVQESADLGLSTRPVLLGPISFLLLGKGRDVFSDGLLMPLLHVYAEVLKKLEKKGVEWVQFDEPCLAMDLAPEVGDILKKAYDFLRSNTQIKLFVASYFGPMADNLPLALSLSVDALHLDLVRGLSDFDKALAQAPSHLTLSLGLVDGRNIWRNDLEASLRLAERGAEKVGLDHLWISSSCSLLHSPYDLATETKMDSELKSWLAFSQQKMEEIVALRQGLNEGRSAIADFLQENEASVASRQKSERIHKPAVHERMEQQPLSSAGRAHPFAVRMALQADKYKLPFFPTTTIGSFPQTEDVRQSRAALRRGKMDAEAYDTFIKGKIEETIKFQNEIGIDVLVHGEFERNDMVEYFAEKLNGFAFTQSGWVQSYGSRCVKPPVIYGDVSRKESMTVKWAMFAQSLTDKPVKGMLTGPVTIVQWSFVRDDQPRRVTAHQIALALQDEVLDLEKAGIGVIQIDEPAFREGLPLRRAAWTNYLTWATEAFRLSSTGVKDETQIHTHMCYSEFNDIISWIRDLDADVISIETSRSQMELLDAFLNFHYPNAIGPGVYDIHSPRIPSKEEMVSLLDAAQQRLDVSQLWVNPDCGLKTRDWPEVKASLKNMVEAAKLMREKIDIAELR